MQIVHTSYIKRLADDTGKTYRELETLWKKFEREVDNERMLNPNKFSHLKSKDGSIAQEVARRFEDFLINPLGTKAEEFNEEVVEGEDELFADEIEDELEEDLGEEVDELSDELQEPSDTESPEINLDDFEDIEDLSEDLSEEPESTSEDEPEDEEN